MCSKFALLLTTSFLGQRAVRVKALQLALRTISAALTPPTHALNGVLGLRGRTASQIELSSHTNRSAKQGLVCIHVSDDHRTVVLFVTSVCAPIRPTQLVIQFVDLLQRGIADAKLSQVVLASVSSYIKSNRPAKGSLTALQSLAVYSSTLGSCDLSLF